MRYNFIQKKKYWKKDIKSNLNQQTKNNPHHQAVTEKKTASKITPTKDVCIPATLKYNNEKNGIYINCASEKIQKIQNILKFLILNKTIKKKIQKMKI